MLIKNYKDFSYPHSIVLNLIGLGIESVLPQSLITNLLEKYNFQNKNIYVIGFGKASSEMALGVEKVLRNRIKKGIVIDTVQRKLKIIKVIKGTHPLPSQKNVNATKRIINLITPLGDNDLLICLISGGGSSLLCYPKIALNEYIKKNKKLLQSGMTIHEINKERKKLSNVKGGRLAGLINKKVLILNLILSDVIGDSLDIIASGPTIAKQKNITDFIIGNNFKALEAMRRKAREFGFKASIYPKSIIFDVEKASIKIAKELRKLTKNEIIIFGGETIAIVKGKGKGGRNQELCLRLIEKIKNQNLIFASVGTDGIDNTDAAGAIIDGNSYKTKLNINEYIKNNDSYTFFKKTKRQIITGKTGTNVCDIMLGLKY